MAESEEELKSLLMRVKEESEKAGLKLNMKKNKVLASSPIISWQIEGENAEVVTDFFFLGSKITVNEIRRWVLLGKKAMTNLDSVLKSKDITLLTKVCIIKAMVFPVVMYRCELDHKDGRVPKNWCFPIMVLEKTLETRLDCREIKLGNPKGNQPWILIGRTGAEAPGLWPPDANSQLIGKDPDAGKDWRQEEKGMTEDKMVGWPISWTESPN